MRYRGDQEVHEDVLAVGGGVNQRAEGGGQVVREQVVVVPGGQTLRCVTSPDTKETGYTSSKLAERFHFLPLQISLDQSCCWRRSLLKHDYPVYI